MKIDRYSLGIDIGSATLKLALIDENNSVIYSSYEKHYSRPFKTLLSSLKKLKTSVHKNPMSISVTGSGRELVNKILDVPKVNEIVAQSEAVSVLHPGTKTIIEIGGQDSKYITLGKPNRFGRVSIISQNMNDICAAGTGAFIEQQAEKLNIPIEQFGKESLKAQKAVVVAGRCAVFAKTDIVHLRQEGVAIPDIAAGICKAVVRNYISQFTKGEKIKAPVVFQGGLAANQGVVKAFREALKISDNDLSIPKYFKVMGAIGASIASRGDDAGNIRSLDSIIEMLLQYINEENNSGQSGYNLPKLIKNTTKINTFSKKGGDYRNVFLGIDIGSTSTCGALISDNGSLLTYSYVLNKGDVIKSVNSILHNLDRSIENEFNDINILGVGVTGSGRYLIGKCIGADIVKDEISAQAKVAMHMRPDVEIIFEIGGQDSKYIRISNGRIVDFSMNKVCAAGTGSFLQEQASRLKIGIDNFSDIAFKSSSPIELGSRCTVFMEYDLINYQQRGTSEEDIVAGLSYSIVNNYLEKVVAGRPIGNKILFLGGVAFNESIVSAFQQIIGKELIVPKYHEVSGAIGIALITRDSYENQQIQKTKFMGFDVLKKKEHTISTSQCGDCSNLCRLNEVNTGSTVFKIGGVCGKYENISTKAKPSVNLFREREKLLFSYLDGSSESSKEKIGISRTHMFYEMFPMWCVFLQELGYEVVVSEPTNSSIINDGLELTTIDNCFSCKIVYGHIHSLQKRGIDKIFYPSIIEFERRVKDMERNHSCPHIQAMPFVLKSTFQSIDITSPILHREASDRDWQKELRKLGKKLKKSSKKIELAISRATDALLDFYKKCEELGNDFFENYKGDNPCIVIMGKTYNVYDKGLNSNIVEKLSNLNIVSIPYDCLPFSNQNLPENYIDMVWSTGQDMIRAAKVVVENKQLYPVVITNFGCGPDSFVLKYMEEIFRDKSFLVLEVDEHTSGVGVITRIEAFINNIKESAGLDFGEISSNFKPYLISNNKKLDKLLYIPIGFDSYKPIASAFESIGIRTKSLPLHNKETQKWGRAYSSGSECLPYIMHVGDAVMMTREPDFDPVNSALFLPASDLACRISLFPTSIKLVLKELGYPNIPIVAPRISMDTDEMLKLYGMKFVKNLFRGILSVELLSKVLCEKRPYEKKSGETDKVYENGVEAICRSLVNGNFWDVLNKVLDNFHEIELDISQRKPVIGLIGDDYTRGNSFANNDFIRLIESMGGEVRNVPIWSSYFEFQMGIKPGRMWQRRKYMESLFDFAKSLIGKIDTKKINRAFEKELRCPSDPSFSSMMEFTGKYINKKNEPLTIIALSHALNLITHNVDGIVNLLDFQCMIHSIVRAHLRNIYQSYPSFPTLTLTFDFLEDIHHKNRIEAFMYQVMHDKKIGAA